MDNVVIQEAIEIIERNRSRGKASYIALYGPLESGKTAFLKRLINYCEREESSRRIIPFYLDLKHAPSNTEDNFYKYVYKTLIEQIRQKKIELEFPSIEVKFDVAFDDLIKQLLAQTESSGSFVLVFIDHIDTISSLRAESLGRRINCF